VRSDKAPVSEHCRIPLQTNFAPTQAGGSQLGQLPKGIPGRLDSTIPHFGVDPVDELRAAPVQHRQQPHLPPMKLWMRLLLPSLFLILASLAGCREPSPARNSPSTSESSAPEKAFTHEIIRPTEYYLGGPQQARPPDGQFPAEMPVRVVEEAGSYTLIEAKTGVQAYVAADAIQRRP